MRMLKTIYTEHIYFGSAKSPFYRSRSALKAMCLLRSNLLIKNLVFSRYILSVSYWGVGCINSTDHRERSVAVFGCNVLFNYSASIGLPYFNTKTAAGNGAINKAFIPHKP